MRLRSKASSKHHVSDLDVDALATMAQGQARVQPAQKPFGKLVASSGMGPLPASAPEASRWSRFSSSALACLHAHDVPSRLSSIPQQSNPDWTRHNHSPHSGHHCRLQACVVHMALVAAAVLIDHLIDSGSWQRRAGRPTDFVSKERHPMKSPKSHCK